jgi:hypothetical protein
MNSAIRLLLVLPLLAFLSACIAVPVKTGDGGDEPFAKKKLAFIEVGRSTKQDIVTAMPHPMQFLGGDLWLYWAARNEANWSAFVALVSPSDIGGGLVPAETGEIDYRFLVIRFDANGVVADLETSRSEKRLGCNRSDVCGTGTTYTLVAPKERDRAVKSLKVPENRCAVHVYGEPNTTIRISLDGEKVGELLGKQGFIFEQLDQGIRQLSIAGKYSGHDRLVRHVDFNCKSGSSVFFQIQTEKRRRFSRLLEIDVMEHDAFEGRKAVEKRRLMLHEGR